MIVQPDSFAVVVGAIRLGALEKYGEELEAALDVLEGDERAEAARELLAVRRQQLDLERVLA